MELVKFSLQMDRLRNIFGDKAYPEERVKLIWREVKEFDPYWFESVVDRFCGEQKFAPLLPEFREEISKERERLAYREKRKHQEAAEEFATRFPPEELKEISAMILKRATHQISEQEWQAFLKVLQEATR